MAEVANAKVVIAEDDAGVLELLRIRLELAGYHTFYARDGHRAVETIRNVVPDAIILDIGLPKLDGFGVLRTIKSDRRMGAIPVLMLSARHSESDVRESLACGAKDYLTKPFDDKKLLARVARLLIAGTKPSPSSENEVRI